MIINQLYRNFFHLLAIYFLCLLAAFTANAAQENTSKTQEKSSVELHQIMQPGIAGHYLASRFARQEGDISAAIHYLEEATRRYPNNTEFMVQLLSMQVIDGKIERALKTAKKLQRMNKNDVLADLLLTIELIKQKDYVAASKKLSTSFDASSGQLWVPLMDIWLEAGIGKIKQPVLMEEMPVTIGKAASVMNYHLALLNNYAGFEKASVQNFYDAAENPGLTPTRIMQYIQAFATTHPNHKNLNKLLEQYKISRGAAPAKLESSISTPQDGVAEVLYTMGNVMQVAGIYHDATVYMQLARYLRPDFHLASFSLAELLNDRKNYRRAKEILATIPPNSQYGQKAILRQALILDRLDKTQEALHMLYELSQKDPQAVDPWIARGDLLRVHSRFLEASIAYGEAIERIGDHPVASDWAVYYARGACMERMGRWNEAKADLEKALELNPNQPDVLNYLGYGMITRGEYLKDARDMLERALAESPNNPQIIDSVGWAYYLLGDYAGALPYLERAVELLASDATVNDHLGDTYWRLGRKTEARFQWKRALTFDPSEEEAQLINHKIMSGLPDIQPNVTKSASSKPVAAATP